MQSIYGSSYIQPEYIPITGTAAVAVSCLGGAIDKCAPSWTGMTAVDLDFFFFFGSVKRDYKITTKENQNRNIVIAAFQFHVNIML